MSDLITIQASERTKVGKGYNRKLRKVGKVPANLMEKGKSTSVELESKLLPKAWKSEGHIFNLEFKGVTTRTKIHELQICPLTRAPLHVDLIRV